MISIARGLEIVIETAAAVRPGRCGTESVDLVAASGRVLGESIRMDADSPPFDKAIRDGFAVVASDVARVPAELRVIGEASAGGAFRGVVSPGTCCEIMTGAEVPSGADAVVMIEHTERLSPDVVRIHRTVRVGTGLLQRGAEARQGDLVLQAGTTIGLAEVGVLAGTGHAKVEVGRRPGVAIVATGNELVDVSETPGAGQIRNSNTYTLRCQSLLAGGEPVSQAIARDDVDDLTTRIGAALRDDSVDILLVSGGVSMGKYDLVEGVFARLGVTQLFDKIAMKPGKPTVFGYSARKFVFGLPGNPLSTIVAFHMFVRPLIRYLLGAADVQPVLHDGVMTGSMKCDPERVGLLPARVDAAGGVHRVAESGWKGSSDLVGLSRANALILVPQREGSLADGDAVRFMRLS